MTNHRNLVREAPRTVAALSLLLLAVWRLDTVVVADDDAAAPPMVRVVAAERSSPEGPRWAGNDSEAHGRLAWLRVDIEADGADPRALRRALARSLGLNFVDHFPRVQPGLEDGVSLSLHDVGALEALEMIIDATSGTSRGTWQVRDGVLEVGPKQTLAVRTAPITRAIGVTDLLLEPPYFVPKPTIGGALSNGGPGFRSNEERRLTPRQVGASLVESIVNAVEPEAWQPPSDAEIADGIRNPVDPRDRWGGRNLDPLLKDPRSGHEAPIYVQGRWASIRLQEGALVVRAPAFVIRGIEGLPPAVPPPASLVTR